jgi:prevent-host-death family protein
MISKIDHGLLFFVATASDLAMVRTNLTSPPPPPGGTWTLAGAKARLSNVVDRAQVGPQTITRNGRPSAVIVSAEEWARKTVRTGTLAEFLLASPLRGADLELERQRDAPRDGTP